MTANDLTRMFAFNAYTVRKNMENVSNDESLVVPDEGRNSINWILGHIVATRAGLLQMVGGASIWETAALKVYRDREQTTSAETSWPVDEILTAFDESQQAIEQWIAESDPRLNEIAGGEGFLEEDETWGNRVAFFALHEAYHAGQIGMLRRLVGKEGAIR
jgi:uncharacterized damage-inducible protein DinB